MIKIQKSYFHRDPASFRDPSGFVFKQDGKIYRKVNPEYLAQYKHLMNSGLYEAMIKENLMVNHEEVDNDSDEGIVIHPEQIPFISYPYEWSYEQYKDAALTTLRIQLLALKFEMVLKDASAYNIQFTRARPLLIDTLSFDMYTETPWVAYGQFCRHFFAPLLLMTYVDERLGKMMQTYIDGIPIDLADSILRGKGGFKTWQHIHLHAKAVKSYGEAGKSDKKPVKLVMKKNLLVSMISSLIRTIEKLKKKTKNTEWANYYSATNYDEVSAKHKETIIKKYLEGIRSIKIKLIWDFGANDGRYSRCALECGAEVIAFDIDHNAVDFNYAAARKEKMKILPLLLDLTCPSPAIGFANKERNTIDGREKPDVVLMLAIIHHLAISNNLPLKQIAEWTASFCKYLIIEFVPKDDSQVQTLLKTRIDIFPDYTVEGFEIAFSYHYQLCSKMNIEKSKRTLYLWGPKKNPEVFQ